MLVFVSVNLKPIIRQKRCATVVCFQDIGIFSGVAIKIFWGFSIIFEWKDHFGYFLRLFPMGLLRFSQLWGRDLDYLVFVEIDI